MVGVRRRSRNVRVAVLATTISGALLLGALSAAASTPIRISGALDVTFKSSRWTNRCGFPVYVRQQGTQTATLFVSRDGSQVVSEIDTNPGFKTTFFSPLSAGGTGGAYTATSAGALRTTYPAGTALGAPAILAFNGLQILFPGLPQAGRDVYQGEVVFVTSDGLPVTDLVAPISSSGTFADLATIIVALCGRLSG